MDEKEKSMTNHYLKLFSTKDFDEYDVYGFLILIRDYAKGWLKDFSHLIAHRIREKGKLHNLLEKVLLESGKNGEIVLNKDGRTVKGYKSLQTSSLQNEIRQFVNKYGYVLDDDTLNQIVLCIFSITHLSECKFDNLGMARMRLIINNKNELWLCAEIKYDGDWKETISFAGLKYNPIETSSIGWWLNKPIEVLRHDDKNIYILYDGIEI